MAIKIDEMSALPWNGWGNSLGELDRHEEAIVKYQRAIELDPNFAHPWSSLGNRLSDLGRHDEAFEKFEKALSVDPNFGLSARNWRIVLNIYLNDLGEDRCGNAADHVARFVEVAGDRVSDREVTDLQEKLEACS